jgi:superfamily II DNA/RNA helicase
MWINMIIDVFKKSRLINREFSGINSLLRNSKMQKENFIKMPIDPLETKTVSILPCLENALMIKFGVFRLTNIQQRAFRVISEYNEHRNNDFGNSSRAIEDLHNIKRRPNLNSGVLIAAETGTGKTLAYILPIANQMLLHLHAAHKGICRPKALVLAPNALLVEQICEQISTIVCRVDPALTVCKYAARVHERSVLAGFESRQQCTDLTEAQPDFLVATPAQVSPLYRRLQHVVAEHRECRPSAFTYIVFDEGDMLLQGDYLQHTGSVIEYYRLQRKWANTSLVLHAPLFVFAAATVSTSGLLSVHRTMTRLVPNVRM